MALMTWAFILLVLVIVVVLLVVKVTSSPASRAQPPVAPAPADVVAEATGVPAVAFDTVGAPAPDGPGPSTLAGQPALTLDGRPGVVYVGAEFCPYCAAERWALVVALGRFGSFSHLGATFSSEDEVFARTPTFSFDGASYRSRYVSFAAVEEFGQALSATAPAGFPALRSATPLERSLLRRYDGGSSVDAGAVLPFVDIGNRTIVTGAGIGFSPGMLQGDSMAQISTDLTDPTSPVAEAVLGAANVLTAAICAVTGGQPASVCHSSAARAGSAHLGTA
jgi:hypothetical protein